LANRSSRESATGVEALTPLKRALLALEGLRAKVETLERAAEQPIAVIGMACRVPGADDVESFWRLVRDGQDAVGEIPGERWDVSRFYDADPEALGKMYTRSGGFLRDVDKFDAGFFEISPREAAGMDPQQRILLEEIWHALEDAGVRPADIRSTAAGVFVGICNRGYGDAIEHPFDPTLIDAFSGTGGMFSVAAGRVSYVLGLTGPSIALDTACSSSLVAVHLACKSLRAAECDLAIAAGVNVILSPWGHVFLSRAGALSADGRCRSFDAGAAGYGRAEGCGVVVLRRLSDAIAAGDRIQAIIAGSAVNHDGGSGGLTVPSGAAQTSVIRQALASARIAPEAVSYLEAHGSGTRLGDPIEARAAAAALRPGREGSPAAPPLRIGTVKTNVGHLEAAAGVVGLIKMALALEHGKLPPQIHFRSLNPLIAEAQLPLQVQAQLEDWPEADGRRIAGVSSFGIGGTNAHVVLTSPPPITREAGVVEDGPAVLYLSAKTEAALREVLVSHRRFLAASPEIPFADVCSTAACGRAHFRYRAAVVASSSAEAVEKIDALLEGEEGERAPGVFVGVAGGVAEAVAGAPACLPAPADGRGELLPAAQSSAAELYVRGIDPDRTSPTQAGYRSKVRLPGYPFQRDRHWVRAEVAGVAAGADEAPLLGKLLDLAVDETVYQTRYAVAALPWLADHTFYGTLIIAGATYLSAVFEAVRRSELGAAVELSSVAFPEPLILDDPARSTRLVQVVLKPERADSMSFRVSGADDDAAVRWRLHAVGGAAALPLDAPAKLEVDGEPLRALPGSGWEDLPIRAFYELGAACGMHAGPTFRWITGIRRRPGEAVAEMVRPDALRNHQAMAVHPGLLDSCFQLLGACLPADVYPPPSGSVPIVARVDAMRIFAPVGGRMFAHIRLRPRDETGRPSRLTSDIRLMDENGESLIEIEGLHIHVVRHDRLCARGEAPEGPATYQIEWNAVVHERREAPTSHGDGVWIVLVDDGTIGEDVVATLRARHERCLIVRKGATFTCDASREACTVHPERTEDFRRAIDWACSMGAHLRGLVHLWTLDVPGTSDGASGPHRDLAFEREGARALDASRVLSLGSALLLAQVLAGGERSRRGRLWLVTRGAQAADAAEGVSPEQAPLWGFGAVLSAEHPELACTLVDLDPSSDSRPGRDLAELLMTPADEDRLALRRGTRYAPRLVYRPVADGSVAGDFDRGAARQIQLDPNASYVITGGLGALGRRVARWMAARGARHLVLVGRRRARPDELREIEAIEATGADVRVAIADVSQRDLLADALSTIPPNHPLRGVVHAAGRVDDGAVVQQTLTRFSNVLSAKMIGAWNLHVLTRDLPLDFFVMFSSTTSVLGAPGQASYAAANAFLDALAHRRRREGRAAVSVSWGPWDVADGMIGALDARSKERWEQAGVGLIPPSRALALLESILMDDWTHVIAAAVDWPKLCARTGARADAGLLAGFTRLARKTRGARRAARGAPALRGRLSELAAPERERLLRDHVRAEAARVLGLASDQAIDPTLELESMGFDSMMAIELRNALQASLDCALPATLLFDHVTLAALCEYLAGAIFPEEAP